ncbi:hypothetical protein Vadar_006386 [Vaccinium darrowii]|uniref:Uncharacterized protein n=1 Tax=Vaccinium darrowii TaxID=229202 RepID=A0ACB7X863_9ERIC|nr:hypothetical protein Vadar_006386 [Vaccinium darrowii]
MSADKITGLEEKTASCFFRNSTAISGELTGMRWTLPRRIHMISVFISSIILYIQRNVGLFLSSPGRLPMMGHGFGPGGSNRAGMDRLFQRMMKIDRMRRRTDIKLKRREGEMPLLDISSVVEALVGGVVNIGLPKAIAMHTKKKKKKKKKKKIELEMSVWKFLLLTTLFIRT